MNILLICPQNEDDVRSPAATNVSYLFGGLAGSPVPPLGLVTLAAVTPRKHRVTIFDENLHGLIDEHLKKHRYDIIGVSIQITQLKRALQIFRYCAHEGIPGIRVLGGIGATSCAVDKYPHVDVVFLGAATKTWPQFLEEVERGRYQPLYERLSLPDPLPPVIPRWELIKDDLPRYAMAAVQTTEGCPNNCDFCAVINLHGRVARHKPVAQVLDEIRTLESLGVKAIFIADDNFIGDRPFVKALLRELVQLNNSFPVPIQFMAQADISMAADTELLELLADSNFVSILVGIESPREEALRDMNKHQNLKYGVRFPVEEIQRHGIIVCGLVILGADTDDTSSFDDTLQYLQDANLASQGAGLLWARVGTRTWYRMKEQGRLVELGDETDDTEESLPDMNRSMTNLIPNKMSRVELLEGYARYLDTTCDLDLFQERAIGFIKGVTRRPRVKAAPLRMLLEKRQMLSRMIRYYLTEATPAERRVFFNVVGAAIRHAPYMVPRAVFLCVRNDIFRHRAGNLSTWARERAEMERKGISVPPLTDTWVPLPESIRANESKWVRMAYDAVRDKVQGGEILYHVLVDALADYLSRWGDSPDHFDDQARARMQESCARALSRVDFTQVDTSDTSEAPKNHPEFVRQVMADLDRRMRRQTSRKVAGGALPRWL